MNNIVDLQRSQRAAKRVFPIFLRASPCQATENKRIEIRQRWLLSFWSQINLIQSCLLIHIYHPFIHFVSFPRKFSEICKLTQIYTRIGCMASSMELGFWFFHVLWRNGTDSMLLLLSIFFSNFSGSLVWNLSKLEEVFSPSNPPVVPEASKNLRISFVHKGHNFHDNFLLGKAWRKGGFDKSNGSIHFEYFDLPAHSPNSFHCLQLTCLSAHSSVPLKLAIQNSHDARP